MDALMAQHADAKLTNLLLTLADRPKRAQSGFAAIRLIASRAEHGIEHLLTKPNHPWTNGQVQRMNRTIRFERELSSLAQREGFSGGEGYFALAIE